MITFKKRNLLILLYLFAYKLFLDLAYVVFVHKYYEYMKFTLDFNQYKYTFSVFIFLVSYSILPKDDYKPSSVILQLHFIIMYLPMFTIYAFMNKSSVFFILNISMFIIQCILIKLIPSVKIVRIRNSKFILYLLLFGITAFVYFSMIKANGVPSLRALNILNVYDIRNTVSYPFLMSYLVNWQGKVINPFFIVTSYLNNSKKNLFIALFMQFVLYLITGHKTFLFMPIAIMFIIIVIFKEGFLKIASKAASLGTIFLLAFFQISKSLVLPSTFLRRFLFVPAQIKFFYYDFFSQHEFMYFSAGAIGKVFGLKYIYDLYPAYMMGAVYFNNPETAANTGYLADAYANMGVFGMFIITLLFVLILKLMDSLSIRIGRELTIGLSLFSILSLNDGALLTNLLTGGLLFLLCVLYLFSSSKSNEKQVLAK